MDVIIVLHKHKHKHKHITPSPFISSPDRKRAPLPLTYHSFSTEHRPFLLSEQILTEPIKYIQKSSKHPQNKTNFTLLFPFHPLHPLLQKEKKNSKNEYMIFYYYYYYHIRLANTDESSQGWRKTQGRK